MPRPISAAALSQIESGKVRPTSKTLGDLAEALDLPVAFFSAQWPGNTPEAAERVTFFRDLRRSPVRERRRAAAIAMLLNDLVSALELHVRLPEVDVPSLPISPSARRDDIENVAASVRARWQLGNDPIPHVVRELERHGVPVARLIVGHKSTDAFSTRTSRRPLVLLAADRDDYVRSRFDASHELGHLVMHGEAEAGTRVVEAQAHDFASCFLLPEGAARELPRRLDAAAWGALAEMKRYWGISIAALLYRAKSLHILDDRNYINAMKMMSARGWRTAEPGTKELGAPESPLMLERAISRCIVTTGQTFEDLLTENGLPSADITALLQASEDGRPLVEL